MASTMKAAIVNKPGDLKIEEVNIPEINDDEVLVKVKYTGICGTDWSIFTGKYSADKLPLIPGHEFSGVIVDMGKNVRKLKIGDRVTADINNSCGNCFYCKTGNKLMCKEFFQLGIHINGSYAEYVKTHWERIYKLPENISFEQGAFIEPLSCVIHSAKAMNVELGSSITIIGTGLGILHAAVAKYKGAAPIIIVGRNEYRLRIAEKMGADYVVNIKKVKSPINEVKKITEGRGSDYVIEAVGTPETYEQAFNMVRPGGNIAAFGITEAEDTIRVKPFELVLGEKKVTGSCAGVGKDWMDAIVLLKYKRINPELMFSMIVPLEELREVMEQIKTDKSLVKVFVSPEINKRIILK